MRTTLTLDDEAFSLAQAYAEARELKLGQAVSELIHRGTEQPLPITKKNGAWVFELPVGTPEVTSRQVKDMVDDRP